MKKRGTVVVVDDDPAMRSAIEALLEIEELEVQGWGSPKDFLAQPLPRPPACVLLDLNMPQMDGLEVQERVSSRSGLPVIFLTGTATVAKSVSAMKGGAVEFLEKPIDAAVLLTAVDRALEQSMALQAEHEDITETRERFDGLTDRQREVIVLASKGMTNAEIGSALGITERTVKFHRQLAMRGMDVESIAEFARIAERAGIC